ncbi:hypothetical protein LTR66_013122 [Elasticomyces elasticus]|nr:hypothetical protein LTR66_013122 [Elasticomyces elasticus]KAK4983466.1 hypothetical protein LTR50_007204 [Elasticomyces elasticus]KAK5003515.1 hypothetical protein LTR28_010076 [Elasticomyces elasticus]
MSLKNDAYPSSAAFDLIRDSLSSDAERKDAIKKGGAIFAFTLKKSKDEQESWFIDLQETGTVGRGTAPDGKSPGVTLILSDAEFAKLISGKANAQKLFISGKLKIKGDVMKATRMEPILKKAQAQVKAKL